MNGARHEINSLVKAAQDMGGDMIGSVDQARSDLERARIAEIKRKAEYVKGRYAGASSKNPDGTVSTQWSGYVPPRAPDPAAGSAHKPPTQQPVQDPRPVPSTTAQTPTAPKPQQSNQPRQPQSKNSQPAWSRFVQPAPGMTPKPATPETAKTTANAASSDIDSFIRDARNQMNDAIKRIGDANAKADTIMVNGNPVSRRQWLKDIDSRWGKDPTATGVRRSSLPTAYKGRTNASTATLYRPMQISDGIRSFNNGSSAGRRLGS